MQKPTFKNKSFTRKQAFTLIELLIVIAIIGILFIVLVSKVDFATDKAKATGVQTDFRSFQIAFDTVAKENAGFNTFGWDTGDANQDGIRNSYDEGDNGAGGGIAQNGIQDGTEVFTGHKVYAETFTKVYSLKKNGTSSYDRDALNRLEAAINANLDPKLQITIKDDSEIVMANGAQDPWNKEYHGWYITNAETDGKDRGAIIMYSDGANNEFGSEHKIANGVVSISVPGDNKNGKDDYAMASVYTYVNGFGEVKNVTSGFATNVTIGEETGNSNLNHDVIIDQDGPQEPDVPQEPEIVIAPGLYTSGQNYAPEALITPWDELVANGIMQVENGSLKCLNNMAIVGDLMVPNDGSITAIADNGFKACTQMTDIKLPDGILTVGNYAFSGLRMNSLVLPDSITIIGSYAFNTAHLLNIHLPANLTSLGSYAFWACFSLTEIEFPDQLTMIDEWTCYGMPELEKVIIGDSVVSIGKQAFEGCTRLTDIEFSDAGKLNTIGNRSFLNCGIIELNIPDGVTWLNSQAFSLCKQLESVVMPNSVNSLYGSVFSGCSNLKTVVLSDNITSISASCFSYCNQLSSINVPSKLTRVSDRAFEECFALSEFVLPETVTYIGSYAFYNTSLSTIVLPDAVAFVWDYAFANCGNLESVVLPNNSEFRIDMYVFQNCTNLANVTIQNATTMNNNIFDQCTNLTTLTYTGTSSQWNALMNKPYIFQTWKDGSYIQYIECTDTIIEL